MYGVSGSSSDGARAWKVCVGVGTGEEMFMPRTPFRFDLADMFEMMDEARL